MSAASSLSPEVRVLVVEDSEDQRRLLTRYFEKAGCVVRVAETAEQAILTYSRWLPDLAVVDLLLPGMTGSELADRLKSDRPQCAIVISSVLDVVSYPRAHAALPKPFTGAQVRRILHEVLPERFAG